MVYGGPHSALGRLRKTNLTSWPAKEMFDQKVKNDKTQCMGMLSSWRWYHSPCKETWKKFPTKLHEACDRCVWKKVCCIFESGKLYDSFARELLDNYWRVLGCNTFSCPPHRFYSFRCFLNVILKSIGHESHKIFHKAIKISSQNVEYLCSLLWNYEANCEAPFAVCFETTKQTAKHPLQFQSKLQRVLRSLLRNFKANCKGNLFFELKLYGFFEKFCEIHAQYFSKFQKTVLWLPKVGKWRGVNVNKSCIDGPSNVQNRGC